MERNVVITQWDWADPKAYLHDEVSTDRRNPTVNANGPIYGATEESTQFLPVVNPSDNSATQDGAERTFHKWYVRTMNIFGRPGSPQRW
mgnify:CR=1 FL=1